MNKNESGAILITGLIFLVIMTILGLSGMQGTILEERMTGNARDHNLAFQASESALRDGEIQISNLAEEPVTSSASGAGYRVLNSPDAAPNNAYNWWAEGASGAAWWAANGVSSNTMDGVATAPLYLIEHRAFVKDSLNVGNQNNQSGRSFYRITARGTGSTDTSKVLLQSTYARRF